MNSNDRALAEENDQKEYSRATMRCQPLRRCLIYLSSWRRATKSRSIHEIYRIMLLLEGRGYLIRAKADRYRLSLKLFEMAHMHPPVNRLVDSALPFMRELVCKSDQSCHLVVLRGSTVLIALQIDSPLPMRYSVALGSHFPVLETSSGAVLLAALPTIEREALIEQIVVSGEAGANRGDIATRLSKIRRLGYEMRASLAVEGCTNISVPIRDHLGTTVAALTVPYLPQKHARFDRQTVLIAALDAANEISRALGAPEPVGSTRINRASNSGRTRHRPVQGEYPDTGGTNLIPQRPRHDEPRH